MDSEKLTTAIRRLKKSDHIMAELIEQLAIL